MNANERFEYMAAKFYKETGTMAPGKDDCLMSHTDEERSTKWREWIEPFYSELFDRDSKSKWINTEDQPPTTNDNLYWVYFPCGKIIICHFNNYGIFGGLVNYWQNLAADDLSMVDTKYIEIIKPLSPPED